MRKHLLTILSFVFSIAFVNAQIDTEFWFAAPDATKGTPQEATGTNRRDTPIFLVLSTLNEPSTVRILQPANLAFTPIQITIDANSTAEVPLADFLDDIESKPANEVLKTGLLIRASVPITAYYEIRSPNNTDIFSLKGRNANGKKFYTPFQTSYENATNLNGVNYDPAPRSGFIVVATTDSTTVNITPSIDMLGHPAGETYSVFLMRGETYYGESIGAFTEEHATGTRIESDKDIAVTVKDDMIDRDISNTSGADIAGDQLIAHEQTGTEHIVVKGNIEENGDRVYILATEDNTTVTIGDEPSFTLNEGEQHTYEFTGNSAYILSDEKVFVWHISGNDDQLAGAAIPPLNCTGSNQVGFVRAQGPYFALNITIRSGSEDSFVLNGDPTLVPATAFSDVLGSNGEYVFARIQYPTSIIPAGETCLLTNFSDELFHLGVTSATAGAGCNYGYFTNFTYLNLGSNKEVCLGDTITLDAGPGKTTYAWNTGDTTQTITISDPGMYTVETYSGSDCYAIDTIQVTHYEPPIDLGLNDTICTGSSLTLEIDGSYLFTWQDGSTGPTYTVENEGTYFVDVVDFQGCTTRDSIHIAERPRPVTPSISGDSIYCAGETIDLSIEELEGASYRFRNPDGNLSFSNNFTFEDAQIEDSGDYIAYNVVEGCESFEDTLNVLIEPSPQFDLGAGDSLCTNLSVTLDPNPGEGNYLWQDGSTDTTFFVNQTGTYTLQVTNAAGCTTTDSVEYLFSPAPPAPVITGEVEYCEGETITISLNEIEDVEYQIFHPSGELFTSSNLIIENATADDSGEYIASLILNGCEGFSSTIDIVVNESPAFDLGEDNSFCGDTIFTLEPNAGPGDYFWQDGSTENTFEVSESGTYILEVTNAGGCSTTDSVSYQINPFPEVPQVDFDANYCEGDEITLSTQNEEGVEYTWNITGEGTLTGSNVTINSASTDNSGQFSVTASNEFCTSQTFTGSFTVVDNPEVSLGDDIVICADSTITLQTDMEYDSYTWSTGDTTATIEAGIGSYSVEVVNSFGCSAIDSIAVNSSGLIADYSYSPDTDLEPNMTISFFDESEAENTDVISWYWTFADFGDETTANTSYFFPAAGTYPVELLVTDNLGCTDSIIKDVVISYPLFIPEVFSPNGDGKNDYFFIRGIDTVQRASLTVFNRWGGLIYEASDYRNNWDAKDVPDGVYFYILKFNNGDDISGNVTITR